jgi:hypothetical protein
MQALPLVGAFSLATLALPMAGAHLDQLPAAAHRGPAAGATASHSLPANTNFVFYSYTDTSVTGMINSTFGGYAGQALRVAQCESSLNPMATNASSDAEGVFQFLASTWAGTSYAGYSRHNAWANINAAHQVFVRDGYSWREWSCQP